MGRVDKTKNWSQSFSLTTIPSMGIHLGRLRKFVTKIDFWFLGTITHFRWRLLNRPTRLQRPEGIMVFITSFSPFYIMCQEINLCRKRRYGRNEDRKYDSSFLSFFMNSLFLFYLLIPFSQFILCYNVTKCPQNS